MTTATRLGIVLARLSFGAMASMGLLALPIVASHPAMAQSHGPAALTGTVSSPEEGKMEGVVVSAKRRWLDHHGFGQHQRAGAVQFSAGPARPRRL